MENQNRVGTGRAPAQKADVLVVSLGTPGARTSAVENSFAVVPDNDLFNRGGESSPTFISRYTILFGLSTDFMNISSKCCLSNIVLAYDNGIEPLCGACFDRQVYGSMM